MYINTLFLNLYINITEQVIQNSRNAEIQYKIVYNYIKTHGKMLFNNEWNDGAIDNHFYRSIFWSCTWKSAIHYIINKKNKS